MHRLVIGLSVTLLTAGVGRAQDRIDAAEPVPAILSPSGLETGANSFTEEQARARLAGAGMSGISALLQDDRGIWRGRAVRDGAPVSVGFDYKGNISAQ